MRTRHRALRGGPRHDPARARRPPDTAIQSEYSLFSRDIEDEVVGVLRELGIGLVAYSPLGRGFLSGAIRSMDDLAQDDFRRRSPRFAGENFDKNLEAVARVEELARDKGITTGQLALAWVLAQDEHVVPIPGTRRVANLQENVAAAEVELTDEDLRVIAETLPEPAGARYDEMGMGLING